MNPLRAILHVVFPTTCVSCGGVLVEGERFLCIHCLAKLPDTGEPLSEGNMLERRLLATTHCEAAAAAFRYLKETPIRPIVHTMKFYSDPDLCLFMGRMLGQLLLESGRFDSVDLLLPVPLHWTRLFQRGYNQCHLLCKGIACVMPRPIDTDSLRRHRRTPKQSLLHTEARQANVANAFSVAHPERLNHRHVLLVDDVATSGSTLTACVDALRRVPDIRISIVTLAHAY